MSSDSDCSDCSISSAPSPSPSPPRAKRHRPERTKRPTAKILESFATLSSEEEHKKKRVENKKREKQLRMMPTAERNRDDYDTPELPELDGYNKRSWRFESTDRCDRSRMEEKEKTEKARREKLLSAATKPAEDPSPLLSMLKPDEKTSYRRELRRLRQRIEETRHLMELGFGRIEACLNNIRAQLQQQPQSSHESNMPPEESGDDRFKVGSDVHLMRLPATTPYSWALNAVAVLFTKEELSTSLLFPSKKSNKPGLDPKRVERLLTLLGKKFRGDTWDMKILQQRINQKCRDTKISSPTPTAAQVEDALPN